MILVKLEKRIFTSDKSMKELEEFAEETRSGDYIHDGHCNIIDMQAAFAAIGDGRAIAVARDSKDFAEAMNRMASTGMSPRTVPRGATKEPKRRGSRRKKT